MDFAWTPELLALRDEANEVAQKAAAGRDILEDSWIVGYDPEFSEECGRRGWIGMTWPKEWGGHGRTDLERFIVTEALISNGAPIAGHWFADRQFGPSILNYGTDEQRKRFLPGILQGTSMWGIGMSEPDSGSDLASLRTKAVLDGDEFVINGQKVWTSGAMLADFLYLICRTDPDAPAHKGLSEIIVPLDAPGIEIRTIRDMSDSEHFCEILIDDVRVHKDNLIGALNGSWGQTMKQLEHERGGIDRLVSNYALYRDVKARIDTADPLLRQQVAEIESGYQIGRLLVLREVMKQAPAGFSAATKTFATEFEQKVAQFCFRAAGMDAQLWGRVSRAVCYMPAYTIMGGTANILREILGTRTLGLPR